MIEYKYLFLTGAIVQTFSIQQVKSYKKMFVCLIIHVYQYFLMLNEFSLLLDSAQNIQCILLYTLKFSFCFSFHNVNHFICYLQYFVIGCHMMFNATFNNISVISWRSVLLMEETGVPGENHRPAASHCQTLSHNAVHLA